jgi:hypothetical protein
MSGTLARALSVSAYTPQPKRKKKMMRARVTVLFDHELSDFQHRTVSKTYFVDSAVVPETMDIYIQGDEVGAIYQVTAVRRVDDGSPDVRSPLRDTVRSDETLPVSDLSRRDLQQRDSRYELPKQGV